MEKIAPYALEIEYRPGPQAVVPDALSRVPGAELVDAADRLSSTERAREVSAARLTSLVYEPGWLCRVHRLMWESEDQETVSLRTRA